MVRHVLALLALLVAVVSVKGVFILDNLPAGAELFMRDGAVKEGFTCRGRQYGYYADPLNHCEIFHVCLPIHIEGGSQDAAKYSFVCGNTTIFDQSTLTCNNEADSLPCSEAEDNYDVINARFAANLDTSENEII